MVCDRMKEMQEENGFKFFVWDGDKIVEGECVVVIGRGWVGEGVDWGDWGYEDWGEGKKGVGCGMNSVDVGIGMGWGC